MPLFDHDIPITEISSEGHAVFTVIKNQGQWPCVSKDMSTLSKLLNVMKALETKL